MDNEEKIKNPNKIKKLNIIVPILCTIVLSAITFLLAINAYQTLIFFLGLPIIIIGMVFSALTGKMINIYAEDHKKRNCNLFWIIILTIVLVIVCKTIIEGNAPYQVCFDSCNDVNTSSAVGSGFFMIAILLLPVWFIVLAGSIEVPEPKAEDKKEDTDDTEEL